MRLFSIFQFLSGGRAANQCVPGWSEIVTPLGTARYRCAVHNGLTIARSRCACYEKLNIIPYCTTFSLWAQGENAKIFRQNGTNYVSSCGCRMPCHCEPAHTLDRNPFFFRNVLTITAFLGKRIAGFALLEMTVEGRRISEKRKRPEAVSASGRDFQISQRRRAAGRSDGRA